MRSRLLPVLFASTAALVAPVLYPSFAAADFHLVSIREVFPGDAGQPDAEYVQFQAYAAGQNFLAEHSVTFHDAAGSTIETEPIDADVADGSNQMTFVMATPAAETRFGIVADEGMSAGLIDPAGGAVCWESLDCVAWGGFAGSTASPVGQPAAPAGIPDGMALRRTIAPGCATLLESADDRDNSAADFSAVFPSPRPNSVKPSEHACESSGGGGSGSGPRSQADGRAPQTVLTRKPAKKTRDRTPTFRFASSKANVHFECKLDSGRFKPCRSPFTTSRLRLGRHTFRVRARDSLGQVDLSPAHYAFAVISKQPASGR